MCILDELLVKKQIRFPIARNSLIAAKRAFDFLVADVHRAVKVEHKQFYVFDVFHFVLCIILRRKNAVVDFCYAAILSRIPLANAYPASESLVAPARRIHSITSLALISLLSQ